MYGEEEEDALSDNTDISRVAHRLANTRFKFGTDQLVDVKNEVDDTALFCIGIRVDHWQA